MKLNVLFCILCSVPFFNLKSQNIISTYAGTGTAGYNGDGIPANTARLRFPSGLAADAAGNIYILQIIIIIESEKLIK